MRVTNHGSHLVQLTRLFAFNSQIVREDDGLTIIDTNLPGSAKGILAAAQALGQPIRRIVLTHAHSDHVGSLDALAAQVPGVEVLISARDARFLAGDNRLDPDEPQTALRGSYVTCMTAPTRLLNDGDRIGSLEAIATPGHTPGHMALLDRRAGTLIAGDAFTTRAGVTTAGTFRLLFPFPALATWNRPTGLVSARRLAALGPSRLAVGHGPVIEAPLAAMQAAIAEAERHLPEVAYAG